MAKLRCTCGPVMGLVAALLCFHLPISAQGTAKPRNRVPNIIDDRVTVARPLDVHPLARKEFDEREGTPDTRMERMVLVLAPSAEQQKELYDLAAAQQNHESPEYHKWLTPETFGNRFGVSVADLDQIVGWLKTHGFEVEPVSPARRSIVFSGSVAQVASTFHTAIHVYNVNGQRHYANATAPRIPVALAEVVRGIVSLHDFHTEPMHRTGGPVTRGRAAPAVTDGQGDYYLAPADFSAIYDLGPLYASSFNGTGQSVAIVGRTNINVRAQWNRPGHRIAGRRDRGPARRGMVRSSGSERGHTTGCLGIDQCQRWGYPLGGVHRQSKPRSHRERQLRRLRTFAGNGREPILERHMAAGCVTGYDGAGRFRRQRGGRV